MWESVNILQKLQSVRAKFQGFSLLEVDDESILIKVDLKVMIIVEMTKYTPTYLNFQHLNALLLESYEAFHCYRSRLLLLALFLNDVFDSSDILAVELALKNPLLKTNKIIIA